MSCGPHTVPKPGLPSHREVRVKRRSPGTGPEGRARELRAQHHSSGVGALHAGSGSPGPQEAATTSAPGGPLVSSGEPALRPSPAPSTTRSHLPGPDDTYPVPDGDEGPGVQVPGGPAGRSGAVSPGSHALLSGQPSLVHILPGSPHPQPRSVCGAACGTARGHGQGLAFRPQREGRALSGRARPVAPAAAQRRCCPGRGPALTVAPSGGCWAVPGETRGQLTWGWAPAAWTRRRFVNPSSSWTFLNGRERRERPLSHCSISISQDRQEPQGPGTDIDAEGQRGRRHDGAPGPPGAQRTCPAWVGGPEPCQSSWNSHPTAT